MPGERLDDEASQDDSQTGRGEREQDDRAPQGRSFEARGGPATIAHSNRHQGGHEKNQHLIRHYVENIVPDNN